MTRRAQPEAALQRSVIRHLTWRARPGVFAFHVPNGGWRSRIESAILKAIGTVAGVPDLICVFQGRVYALELKAGRGRLTDVQRAVHERLRGVLAPVLDQYAVGFRVMHGFSSATSVHDVADDDDGRDLIALYVGDYDPSGLFMSEQDLLAQLAEYDGEHCGVSRIALIREQASDLPSFPVTDKRADPRFNWFRDRYGGRCWELDAMDPNDLRDCVQKAIIELIEPVAWKRCEKVNKAEQESLKTILEKWGA
jgi:hypothetical protein